MGSAPKFLILRFSSIGDIVLTTPVIRCIKQQIPDAEIHFATKEVYAEVLANNPYIDVLHMLNEANERRLLSHLRSIQFDYIIDLHHNLRTWKFKWFLRKSTSYSFSKENIKKWLLTAWKKNLLPDTHVVDRYMETVRHLQVKNDGRGLDFFLSEKDHISKTELPLTHIHGYVALAVGAAHATKQIPLEKLKILCAALPTPIVLLGGKTDAVMGQALESEDKIKIYNACGKFKLGETAFLIKNCKLLITPDTGLMHIGAALKIPIISIWGNTVPAFGMYPYYGDANISNRIVEIHGLSCRPCSKIGYQTCPRIHFNCMMKHDMQKIADLAAKLLNP
jgi:ADP-heptose:LPS heptosyltransferase